MDDARRVYINGLGLAIGDFREFETLTKALPDSGNFLPKQVLSIQKLSNKIQLRKMDRISKLSLLAALRARDDAQLLNMEKVGTVFNSVFGPLQTNLALAQYIIDKDIDGVSPSMFANTVNNACVGYVCLELGCKGVSTMLLESNYVGYSIHLIKSNKADMILAGGVDEYTGSIFKRIEENGYDVVEGAAVLALGNRITPNTYCEILGYYETMIGEHPYYCTEKKDYRENIKSIINRAMEKAQVTAEDISGLVSEAPAVQKDEEQAVQSIFDMQEFFINEIKSDALGASIGVGLGIASVLLKQAKNSVLLVTNLDYSGVYRVFIVKRI